MCKKKCNFVQNFCIYNLKLVTIMKQERELKRLTLDELYDIFETEQYDEFRADFGEELIVHGDFTVRAFMESIRNIDSTPLVYQHIMTKRLLAQVPSSMSTEVQTVCCLYGIMEWNHMKSEKRKYFINLL